MIERPLVTVGGLIVAPDGEILLVRSEKWKNLYSLPGGKVEWGEIREEAFIREVREETGLHIHKLKFAMVQECIFSDEFWKKKHFVMNDYIAELHSSSSKLDVQLNDEAYNFIWILPEKALSLPLHQQCRHLIEWYVGTYGMIGIENHSVTCIIGVYPEEREMERSLFLDVKLKMNLFRCAKNDSFEDAVNYELIASLCTEVATKKFHLLEAFASAILDECFAKFPIIWGYVKIRKPQAIDHLTDAIVILERGL